MYPGQTALSTNMYKIVLRACSLSYLWLAALSPEKYLGQPALGTKTYPGQAALGT